MTDKWHIKRGNKVHGPISSEQLRNLANIGKLRPTDLVRNDKSDWRQADSISGLFVHSGNQQTNSGSSQTNSDLNTVRKNWALKGLIGLGVICFGFFLLCAGILGGIAGSSGTITFAEEVNEKTLETTNEGTEFTTGWVAMIIRSRNAFGESKLIITYRKNGEQMWQVLDQHSVDPQWDMIAAPVLLAEPGDYEIAAKTASGKLIAKNSVTIVP